MGYSFMVETQSNLMAGVYVQKIQDELV